MHRLSSVNRQEERLTWEIVALKDRQQQEMESKLQVHSHLTLMAQILVPAGFSSVFSHLASGHHGLDDGQLYTILYHKVHKSAATCRTRMHVTMDARHQNSLTPLGVETHVCLFESLQLEGSYVGDLQCYCLKGSTMGKTCLSGDKLLTQCWGGA